MRTHISHTGLLLFAIATTWTRPAHAADVLYVKAAHVIVDASRPAISPGALVITDGVVTDGAVTDGAVTDGAITDGAITPGAISYGDVTPSGAAHLYVNGVALN